MQTPMNRMPARPVVALSLRPSALAGTSGLDPGVAPRFTVLAVNHLCALSFPLFSPSACRGSRRAMRARWISRLSCAPSVAARTSTRPGPPQSLTRPVPAQRRKAPAAMSQPRLRLTSTSRPSRRHHRPWTCRLLSLHPPCLGRSASRLRATSACHRLLVAHRVRAPERI